MSQSTRILWGVGAALLTGIAVTLLLELLVGRDAVNAFLPLVLFGGALVGFLVWYFTVPRESEGTISPSRAIRSALIGGALGAWSFVKFVQSMDWPLLGFALVGFVWCGAWIAWFARHRG